MTLNIKDVLRGIDDLGENIVKSLDIGLRKSAVIIQGTAKEYAPVDTGTLRSRINTYFGHLQASIIPETDYAVYVEFNDKAYHRTGRAHFMRDSLENNRNDMIKIFENELEKAVVNFNN